MSGMRLFPMLLLFLGTACGSAGGLGFTLVTVFPMLVLFLDCAFEASGGWDLAVIPGWLKVALL